MKRLQTIKTHFITSVQNGRCRRNTEQECLIRLKTYNEKEKFIKFLETQK
ncbi:hypothetical protein [Bacillus cereus]|nr:hypothetical protein [Bacillus cereus]